MQKGQSLTTSGPNWKYNSLDSREMILFRRAVSLGARPVGRRPWRRVKRTSTGIWRRDWVRLNIFSEAKYGSATMRKRRAVPPRMIIACKTFLGRGRIATPGMLAVLRWER